MLEAFAHGLSCLFVELPGQNGLRFLCQCRKGNQGEQAAGSAPHEAQVLEKWMHVVWFNQSSPSIERRFAGCQLKTSRPLRWPAAHCGISCCLLISSARFFSLTPP